MATPAPPIPGIRNATITDASKTSAPDEAEEETSRRLDPELRCMGAMLRLLGELDEPAKARAVWWLSARYKEADK